MVYLQLPATLCSRYLAVRAVAALCRCLGQPRDLIDAVVSAVGEAFNNAVLHGTSAGHGPRGGLEVQIEIGLTARALEIRVLDYGRGFTLSDVPVPDFDPLAIDDLPESGMGLYIIRALMTDVAYRRGSPNVLYMRKELSTPSAAPPAAPPTSASRAHHAEA